MSFITIDPYYDVSFFNESKEALKNNGVDYSIYINIKPGYQWYFKMDESPVMVNYDTATKQQERWLVSTVKPLKPNDEYLLLRRNKDNGPGALLRFIENEPLKTARTADYAVFFTVRNREEIENISKEYPGKIWFMGKYYNNKFRVCLCTHEAVKVFLDPDQILLEKRKELEEPGRFEAELNFRVLMGRDELVKFTETPYFFKGKQHKPNIQGEHSGRFIL